MSTDIDIRQQLRLPVFDPDYYKTRVGRTSSQHWQQQQQPSPGSSQETYSDDTDDESDRESYKRPSATSPSSAEHKTVRFGREHERGRTAAGNDVGNGRDDRTAPSRRNNDGERSTAAAKKKKKAASKGLKWKPAKVDADSQPIGTRPRRQWQEDEDADSQLTKNTRSAAGGEVRSKPAAATPEHKTVRPAGFYPRYKYPAKFHRIVGVTTANKPSNELIPGNFVVPDCLRRPTCIHLLPVRQGPDPAARNRDERNRKKDRPSTTTGAGSEGAKTKSRRASNNDDNQRPNDESTDATAADLNGTYHVVHVEPQKDATSKRRNKSVGDSGEDSDPETAVSRERVSSRSSSDSEGYDEPERDAYARGSSNATPEGKSGTKSKTVAAKQQTAGLDRDARSSDVTDDGESNYSDDFDD